MKTVVFVDELLLVNFAAAAALLLGAGLLCGRSCTGLRLCAGSAAAAVSTLVLLAPPWPAPLAVLYKIASCCGVVAVCYGVSGARSFARLCGWYAALNGLLCGAVVLVQYPPLRSRLPAPLRAYLDSWFASGTAPPPGLRVQFVPCAAVTGHCLLPAVPAALCRGQRRVPGLLAAFCAPDAPTGAWTLLLGDDVAEEVGV